MAQRRTFNKFKRPNPPSPRKRMLDVRRRDHFSYDMKQVLSGSTLPPEQVASFLATLFARGSLGSSDDAKEFAQVKFEEKLYGNRTRDDIFRLIDHYSKWR